MQSINQAAHDILMQTQHIREVVHMLADKLGGGQFQEVETSLAIKPDFVPDLTKMEMKKDTMVMSVCLALTPRPGIGNDVIEQHRAIIHVIHSRHALIGPKLTDGSFPVTFHDKVSDLETTEYFKQYQEDPDADLNNWASQKAAKDIWKFLISGAKPIP